MVAGSPFAAFIINVLALSTYSFAYGIWLIECLISKESSQNKKEWYGFAPTKKQILTACIIGLIGVAVGIATIFYPFLIIPTCWIFAASNSLWLIGEYQKSENNLRQTGEQSQLDPNFQHAKQAAYLHYATVVTIISLVTAVITTATVLYPPLLWLALFIGPYLGGMVIKAWIDVNFFKPIDKFNAKTATSNEKINSMVSLTPFDPDANPRCLPPENRITSRDTPMFYSPGRNNDNPSKPSSEAHPQTMP
ncbi:MAG: hypothetical protein A3F18_06495 [Legionellales bacterium RIFCSPHIGHO2_12_FULL_37_14]|nr:MAG: hypothetical protein A3F18_06495 [Legionellales bacterium RIFCSPHIGHO2_12_FULL_37_14]